MKTKRQTKMLELIKKQQRFLLIKEKSVQHEQPDILQLQL